MRGTWIGPALLSILLLGGCAGAPPRSDQPAPEATPQPVPEVEPHPVEKPPPGPLSAPIPHREPARKQRPAATTPPKDAVDCPPGEVRSAWDLFLEGIDRLQVGDVTGARRWLTLALCRDPRHERSLAVIRQIDSPLTELFKQQFAEYRVQPGDTLSKIAKQAYGDAFLFYALARFNGIENPSRVAAGQVLRVPELGVGETVRIPSGGASAPSPPKPVADRTPPEVGARPSGGRFQSPVVVTLSATDDTDPSPRIRYTLDGTDPAREGEKYAAPVRIESTATLRFMAEDQSGNSTPVRSEDYLISARVKYQDVEDSRERGDNAAALDRLKQILSDDPDDLEARRLYAEIAVIHADALQAQGDLSGARELLQQASRFQPDNREIQSNLAALDQRMGIAQLLQTAADAMEQGDYEAAHDALSQVLEMEPTHATARENRSVVRAELVDQYGKGAVAAFRRQDLDESIRLWDKVLELEPDNEEALLRRRESVHLKEVFEKKFN